MKFSLPTRQLLEPNRCRSCMCIQTFSFSQPRNFFRRLFQRFTRITQHTGAPDKIENTQRGRESRCSGSRQYMIWTGEVIANDFGSVRPEEYCSGMMDSLRHRLVIAGNNFQVLWRQSIDNCAGLVEILD